MLRAPPCLWIEGRKSHEAGNGSYPIQTISRIACCCTRRTATSGLMTAGSPTASCPMAPASGLSAPCSDPNAVVPTAPGSARSSRPPPSGRPTPTLNLALVPDGGAASAPTATSRTTRASATSASAPSRCPPASSPRPSSRRRQRRHRSPATSSSTPPCLADRLRLRPATVAAHEFGHALGLGESTVSTAVMYGTYNGIKTGAGQRRHLRHPVDLRRPAVRPVQHRRPSHNSSVLTATNITSVHQRQRPDRDPGPGQYHCRPSRSGTSSRSRRRPPGR